MYDIIMYEDKNGKSELQEYLKQLQNNPSKDNNIKLKKITSYIDNLSMYGLTLGEPYIKHIDSDIWELRPIRDRILFTSWYNNKFILLSVFTKNTQKTPRKEIEKAKRLLKDYIKRSGV
ncbi:MAG: type II toxin-antitoxin system RelE/ParE family toxin [Clostridia bacterium]|nr:type II toxin-antitoxin system RelE/ParE family toxin [Clostridia bacterium]MCI9275909.1 type II toxin-antitoxin system RelE/ParE family toxin [Clostridia bacterium]